MADTDYAPVTSPEEEEEERRRTAQEYPAPQVPASAMPAKEPMPSYPAATTPAQPIQAEMGKRPSPSDYPAADLHGWRKGLGALFTGMASFRSPEAGEQVYKHLFVEPGERAQQQYETASSDYDKQLAQKQAAAKEESESSLRGAQAEEAKARTANLQHPQDKVGNTPEELTLHYLLTGDNGKPITNPETGKPYNTVEAYRALKEIGSETKPPGQEQNKLDFQAVAAKVDAAGLPTGPKEIDKSLDAARKRGVITADEHAKARAYQAANPTPGTNLTVHVAGAQQAQGFQHNEKAEAETYKRYETAQDAEQRLSRMEASYAKGINGDQQAMLALLTDHIGMTLGLQKGARITKDILHEATASMPWLEKIESKFDSRGYLSGVTLGREQMAQMLDLGYEARDRAVQGAQDSSHLYGVKPPPGAAEVFGKRKLGEKPALEKSAAGNEPSRPARVPADYIYQEKGPQGKGWYKPTPKP